MLRIIPLLLALTVAPALAQITTQGPGDGCAPYTDGTVNPHCLEVLRPTALADRQSPPPVATPLETLDVSGMAPGPTPLAALAPLLAPEYAEPDEGTVRREIRLVERGRMVDFLIRTTGWADDSTTGNELFGRLVRGEAGDFAFRQLHRRFLCSRGVSDGGRCL